jgi:hypothetical protein
MSLRSFHVFFIVLSVLLAAGCAWWAFATGASIAFGCCSAVIAIGLGFYAVSFIKKSRKLIL